GSAADDARRCADQLGIEFAVWDFSARFRTEVVDYFIAEYAAGRTPNPCLRCNAKIKFGALLDRARVLGFDAVVTGHHARLVDGRLARSVNPDKDQSYVLAVLDRDQLARVIFPLGDHTKAEVRAEAARRGLPVADKADSLDICFIPDGDHRGFLARELGASPGPIVDAVTGAVVGAHDGAAGFTVGQRRGLALSRPAPDGARRYVLAVRPAERTVMVGPGALLDCAEIVATRPVWSAGAPPDAAFDAVVQLRAHGMVCPAEVRVDGETVTARLRAPQRGVAAGQAMVLYDGDFVLGSATIERVGSPLAGDEIGGNQ
ncbi:MAG: tRNA 2-thiouridine(34) synthase MnmA, partial [Actinomycetia bacterium]|nr:tRNA 2-thiouridine(34) synthase MnmA [Actinomycetes bacterium]